MKKGLLFIALLFQSTVFCQVGSNLIMNGSFEDQNGTAANWGLYFVNGYVDCWFEVVPSCDLMPNPLTGIYQGGYYNFLAYDGTYFAHGAGSFNGNGCDLSTEALGTGVMILPNKAYRLKYWFKCYIEPGTDSPIYHVELHNSATTDGCVVTSTPFQTIVYETIGVLDPENVSWQQKEVYFTADASYTQLVFYPTSDNGPDGYMAAFLDKVELYEDCSQYWEVSSGTLSGVHYYGDYIEVSGTAETNAGTKAHLIAGNYIELLPNFEAVQPNSSKFFLAEINPCEFESDPQCPEPKFDVATSPNSQIPLVDKENSVIKVDIQSRTIVANLISSEVNILSYCLYSLDGKIIDQQICYNRNSVSIDVLSSGMYVLNIILSDGSAKSFKIVI